MLEMDADKPPLEKSSEIIDKGSTINNITLICLIRTYVVATWQFTVGI